MVKLVVHGSGVSCEDSNTCMDKGEGLMVTIPRVGTRRVAFSGIVREGCVCVQLMLAGTVRQTESLQQNVLGERPEREVKVDSRDKFGYKLLFTVLSFTVH